MHMLNLIWLVEFWSGHPPGLWLTLSSSLQLATSFGDKHHHQASVSLKAAAPWKQIDFQKQDWLAQASDTEFLSIFCFRVSSSSSSFFLLSYSSLFTFSQDLYKSFKKMCTALQCVLYNIQWTRTRHNTNPAFCTVFFAREVRCRVIHV